MTITRDERINLNDLSHNAKCELAKSIYEGTSYFQRLFAKDCAEFDCIELVKKFRNEILRLLVEKRLISTPIILEHLHEYLSADMRAYNFDDGVNKISTYFYETDTQFMLVYHQLIAYLRTHVIKEPFWFQKIPTIRIHCPNAKNSDHYPRYHTDIAYGHPPEETNIWIPFTEIMEGHGFRIMTYQQSKDILEKFNYDFSAFIKKAVEDKAFSNHCESLAQPVKTALGKLFTFDSRCIHTGEPLKNHTRISMDMRIMPLSLYKNMQIIYQGSGRRKTIFAPGHCYHENNSEQFMGKI